jgi:hypothetical protein
MRGRLARETGAQQRLRIEAAQRIGTMSILCDFPCRRGRSSLLVELLQRGVRAAQRGDD